MSIKPEIRLAVSSDMPELIGLLNDLFSQDLEFVPNFEKQKKGLQLIFNNPDYGQILVAEENRKIIGMVSILYSISTALGSKVGILEDMIIEKNFRQNGLGSQLLQYAIDFAKNNGCARITLLTDYNNDPAINFYKKFGFVKSEMIPMRLVF